jgi:hypothetical protein
MLVDNRCGSMRANVPFCYCRAGTKGHFLWKKWTSRSMGELDLETESALCFPLGAKSSNSVSRCSSYPEVSTAMQAREGLLASELQPADWLGSARVISRSSIVNSARLTCSAEVCRAAWACLPHSLRWRERSQTPGGGIPVLRWLDRNPRTKRTFTPLKSLPSDSFPPKLN